MIRAYWRIRAVHPLGEIEESAPLSWEYVHYLAPAWQALYRNSRVEIVRAS